MGFEKRQPRQGMYEHALQSAIKNNVFNSFVASVKYYYVCSLQKVEEIIIKEYIISAVGALKTVTSS